MLGLNLSLSSNRPPPFNPSGLFRGGEAGVWYDPSDLSTLFQDSAGTTPVTDVEQPVGLMLDKSKVLALGPELVTNGTFDTDTTWSKSAGVTIADGVCSFSGVGNLSGVSKSLVSPGKYYEFSFEIKSIASGGFRMWLGGSVGQPIYSSVGTHTFRFVASSATAGVLASTAGTTGTIDNISVREIYGNHAYQTTATSRPVLKQDSNGKYYLRFDGVDDWLVTPTITPGTDKAQVFAGVRKLSDATSQIVVESSSRSFLNQGAFGLFSSTAMQANSYAFQAGGSIPTSSQVLASGFAPPQTNILTGLDNISGDSAILRVNGTQAASITADQGTGNFLAYPLYIGRRGGTSLPLNGHLYSLIVRFGSNLPIETIEKIEKYVNRKTRAY